MWLQKKRYWNKIYSWAVATVAVEELKQTDCERSHLFICAVGKRRTLEPPLEVLFTFTKKKDIDCSRI